MGRVEKRAGSVKNQHQARFFGVKGLIGIVVDVVILKSTDPIFSSLFFPLYFYKMVRLFPFFIQIAFLIFTYNQTKRIIFDILFPNF